MGAEGIDVMSSGNKLRSSADCVVLHVAGAYLRPGLQCMARYLHLGSIVHHQCEEIMCIVARRAFVQHLQAGSINELCIHSIWPLNARLHTTVGYLEAELQSRCKLGHSCQPLHVKQRCLGSLPSQQALPAVQILHRVERSC